MCACRSPTAATCAAAIAWPRRCVSCRKREILALEEIVDARRHLHRAGRDPDPADRRRTPGSARESPSWSARLGARIGRGLDELTMTTNGTQLAGFAERLRAGRHTARERQPRQPASRTGSATSPATAISIGCWPASVPPRRRASRSRSTWSRSRGSTRTRSRTCCVWCAGRGLRSHPDRDHAARRGRGGSRHPLSAARAW